MPLKARLNDTPEVIVRRLQHYRDCVEPYYQAALSIFPSICYDSNGSLEECAVFYDDLAKEIANCTADSAFFAQAFRERQMNF